MHFSKEVLAYIQKNEKADIFKLVLKKSPFEEYSMKQLVQQIQGIQIARSKFPSLLKFPQYIFPPKISLEQASSEKTAIFKSKLIDGKSFLDLTGGMGIDTYFMSRNFQEVTYVEKDESLFKSTNQNFITLGLVVKGFNTKAEEFLSSTTKKYDTIFIDPSRRVQGQKRISIDNCLPNIVEIQKLLLEHGNEVLIKLSPMQDLSELLNKLDDVTNIYIVADGWDVKELLVKLNKADSNKIYYSAVDVHTDHIHTALKDHVDISYVQPLHYIYQPHPTLVKADLQDAYSNNLSLQKIHPNTQLYTSDSLVENYFGRVFEVVSLNEINKKTITSFTDNKAINVISKNYPLSASDLKKKYKVKDGGDFYLLAFTGLNEEKYQSICKRIS